MADTRIYKNFTDVKLKSDKQGWKDYFDLIMKQLSEQTFAIFKVGVPMEEGVGGYFTVKNNIVSICLPKSSAVEVEPNLVEFASEEKFAIFVHECSHFQHFIVDEGQFMSPRLFGKTYDAEVFYDHKKHIAPADRRNCEYEAGYRALVSDKKYKLFPGSRINLELQLINLLNYDLDKQSKETKETIKKLTKDKKGDEYQQIIKENICDKVKKLSEWEDPEHVIKV